MLLVNGFNSINDIKSKNTSKMTSSETHGYDSYEYPWVSDDAKMIGQTKPVTI